RDFQLKNYPIVGAQGIAPLHVYFGFGIIYFLVFPKGLSNNKFLNIFCGMTVCPFRIDSLF
ncbi:hypothetical protein, partial [Scytonema sp. UIC 10036]|uniref:hypothetical protein n=1 Tax=Scytonema sp. UIC 10036 TaxID=2304196 RepID=UPI001A9AC9F6